MPEPQILTLKCQNRSLKFCILFSVFLPAFFFITRPENFLLPCLKQSQAKGPLILEILITSTVCYCETVQIGPCLRKSSCHFHENHGKGCHFGLFKLTEGMFDAVWEGTEGRNSLKGDYIKVATSCLICLLLDLIWCSRSDFDLDRSSGYCLVSPSCQPRAEMLHHKWKLFLVLKLRLCRQA